MRKIRVAQEGRGKRGSTRAIYLYVAAPGKIYLLLVYAKNVQTDLTPDQTRVIRALADRLKKEDRDG